MPESLIVCPHCEKSVEVPVTSVTRSRECPNCGKVIMLRVNASESSGRGTALLTGVVEKADVLAVAGHSVSEATETNPAEPDSVVASENEISPQGESVSPQVLLGDIRRRMMHDPEVQARIKTLQWGGGILGGIIVLLVVASFLNFWSILGGWLVPADKRDLLAKSDALLIPTGEMHRAAPEQKAEIRAKELTTQESHAPWRTASRNEATNAVPLTDEARAMKAAMVFLGAKNVDERLKLVRDVKLMEPKMRSYYAKHDGGPIEFDRIEPQEKNPMGESTFGLSVVMPKGERRRMIVGLAKSGDYVVDWASFVLYAEMDWSEFIAQKPEEPKIFRVLAVPDERIKDGFSNPKELICLKLVDPRDLRSKPVWGYASRNTTLGRSLEFLFNGSSGESLPLLVGLKYEPLSPSNDQVWISELVAQGWVAHGK